MLSNLSQSSTEAEKRNSIVIDGKKYTARQVRYVLNRETILAKMKEQIGNGTFRVNTLKRKTALKYGQSKPLLSLKGWAVMPLWKS